MLNELYPFMYELTSHRAISNLKGLVSKYLDYNKDRIGKVWYQKTTIFGNHEMYTAVTHSLKQYDGIYSLQQMTSKLVTKEL